MTSSKWVLHYGRLECRQGRVNHINLYQNLVASTERHLYSVKLMINSNITECTFNQNAAALNGTKPELLFGLTQSLVFSLTNVKMYNLPIVI